MSRDEYDRALLEQLHARARWENETETGWTVDDLDQTEVVRTMEEAIRRGRSEDPGTRAAAAVLRGFGLLRGASS
jgi:ATP-dependent DNA helicase RecG